MGGQCIEEPVEFYSGDIKLAGVIHKPDNYDKDNPNHKVGFFVHGFPLGNMGHPVAGNQPLDTPEKNPYFLPTAIGQELGQDNFYLRFSLMGSLGSDGKFEDKTPLKHVDNIAAAVDFIEKESEKNIDFIIAHSSGATEALHYLQRHNTQTFGSKAYSKVPYLILISAAHCINQAISKDFSEERLSQFQKDGEIVYANEKWFNGFKLRVDYLNSLRDLCIPPTLIGYQGKTLILHGAIDETYPVEFVEHIMDLTNKPTQNIVSGANHIFKGKEMETAQIIREFLSKEE